MTEWLLLIQQCPLLQGAKRHSVCYTGLSDSREARSPTKFESLLQFGKDTHF